MDFDLAFGNSTLLGAQAIQGWRFQESEKEGKASAVAPPWWSILYADNSFRYALYKRWTTLRGLLFSNAYIDSMVDSLSAQIAPVRDRNFSRWPVIKRPVLWAAPPATTYEGELKMLKNWLHERANWMDEELTQSLQRYR